MSRNHAASKLVLEPYSEEAVVRAARETLAAVGGKVSCAFVFCSADYRAHLTDFLEVVQLHGHVPIIAGCSGAGLCHTAQEAEHARGFSLLFMHLPETRVHAVPLSMAGLEQLPEPATLRQQIGVEAGKVTGWVAVGDPYQMPVEPWCDLWNAAYPGEPCVGGLASGGTRGDEFFVFHERRQIEGAVMLGFEGGVKMHALVSQGARPIGEPMTVTGAEGNLVISLASRPAYAVLDETYGGLNEEDRRLAARNLLVGLATTEDREEYGPGDFLVRNLVGADPVQGILAIGAVPRVGQTLQFQLRDRVSADAEMRHLCGGLRAAGVQPFASLLFACAGRGKHLFGAANHDANVLADVLGPHPSAGIFCNGEIGPVRGRNYIHGYTATAALFTDA